MPAVVLAPGEFAVKQASVVGRHFGDVIIVGVADVLRAEQTEHSAGVNRGAHKAINSLESTGRSPAFLLPKEDFAAPYFMKLPAIQ